METKNCLLIENDPEDQQFFMDTVHAVAAEAGCYAVSNAEEALDVIQAQAFKPDYIFTELNLPGTDGLTLIKLLIAHKSIAGVPVIVYTSDYSDAQIEKIKKAGAHAIFSKTRMSALPAVLKKIFEREMIR